MILIAHITLATISIVSATYTAFFPSRKKLLANYVLTVGTILSGIAVLFFNPQELGRTCLSGLVFIGVITATSVITKHRLASGNTDEKIF